MSDNNRRNVINRLFTRILIRNTNSSDPDVRLSRNLFSFARRIREDNTGIVLSEDDIIDSNSFQGNSYDDNDDASVNSDELNSEVLHILKNRKKKISNQDWMNSLKHEENDINIKNNLVLDFLLRSGKKEAAKIFIKESGIELKNVIENKVHLLIDQISELLDQNKIKEIEELLISIDPDIVKYQVELFCFLRGFQIRKTLFKDFNEFSNLIKEYFLALLNSIDKNKLRDYVDSPYSQIEIESSLNVDKILLEENKRTRKNTEVNSQRKLSLGETPDFLSKNELLIDNKCNNYFKSIQKKIFLKIDSLTSEFILNEYSNQNKIDNDKKTIIRAINSIILVFFKLNPMSKLEQLIFFTYNFQNILRKSTNFPVISDKRFELNKRMFIQPEN